MASPPFIVYRLQMPDGPKDIVSILPREAAFSDGLIAEAIVGVLHKLGGKIAPENFARNRAFVEFLHDFIGRCGSEIPTLQAAARRQGDGWLILVDGRTPDPDRGVPPHDIIGVFKVQAGSILPGSYCANDKHVLLSPDGFFDLEPMVFERLVEELVTRNEKCFSNLRRTPPSAKPWWKAW